MSKKELPTSSQQTAAVLPQGYIDELRAMIDLRKESVAVTVNFQLTMLYWHLGSRVRREILHNQRAEYR